MTAGRFGGRVLMLGAVLALGAPLSVSDAAASRLRPSHGVRHGTVSAIEAGMRSYAHGGGRSVARFGRVGGGLQCVPFARENSGIELTGNAATWWAGAEGVYERGSKPEVGSVLNFRATGRMRMGHVAVVTNVVNGRSVEIDHANWAGPGASRGGVSRNITVVDVSPGNDWTAVRVALGHTEDYGSVYPTYGFIYDRPDRGTMVANAGVTPSAPTATASLASVDAGGASEAEEVAEAADDVPSRGHSYRAHRHHHLARAGFGRASVMRVHSQSAMAPRHGGHRHRT